MAVRSAGIDKLLAGGCSFGMTIDVLALLDKRREYAVIDRARLADAALAFKLGFRNESNDVVHVYALA